MDLCYQTIKRCVVVLALWLVMSSSDCKAVPNDTTRLVGWLVGCPPAVLLDCWDGCVCASLVRTERKSLARVVTPVALDLSLCLLQCMLRCRLCACCCPFSVCVWASLRAPPPIGLKCAVCHMSSDTATRLAGSVLCWWMGGMGVCVW